MSIQVCAPRAIAIAGALAALVGGCGASTTATADTTGTGAQGAGAGAGTGEGGLFQAGPGGGAGASGASGSTGQTGTSCAGVSEKGDLVPLDMYLLLDKSGSMYDHTGPTGEGPSKWASVTEALETFFAASASKGISVGLQFFPLEKAGEPGTLSCSAADYAAPAVEIAPLAAGPQALLDAIADNEPDGLTPTGPALEGALAHAKDWATAHPDHRVVAVLATDGLPTECDPQEIDAIAALAADGKDGKPGIQTFVIGVFNPTDVGAQGNLDQIAQEGGTGTAFFIADNQDVSQAFLAALESIQGKSLACEYTLPAAPDGSELAYDEVNVEHTSSPGAPPDTVPYVADASACDPVSGGWYYDNNPESGQAPTKILICPATCTTLTSSTGQVDIRIGCQTVVPEAR